jgi:hypothetical protein
VRIGVLGWCQLLKRKDEYEKVLYSNRASLMRSCELVL